MGDDIFIGMVLYFLTGFLGMEVIFTCRDDEMNPLWKIPLLLSGPLTFAIVVIIVIIQIIKNYIEDVKKYYRRKNEKRRKEYEKNFSSNRYAE